MATGPGDRWSDLDLSFAVGKGFSVGPVLEDWTAKLMAEFSANKLFEIPAGQSIYRVLLLPGCLQFDLSFTPAPDFGAIGPNFKLLFGEAVEKPHSATARLRICSGMPSITWSGLASASNAVACCKPSTGSVLPATTLLTSPA